MNTEYQELQQAIEFVRRTFADQKIELDYTPSSVKHLDRLFDNEFERGKLARPDSSFAKYQGLIMTGIAGYLAEVIVKNTRQSNIHIPGGDKNWYMNFKVIGSNNWMAWPGKRVVKRMMEGAKAGFHEYVRIAIKYFNRPEAAPGPQGQLVEIPTHETKPWWQFW